MMLRRIARPMLAAWFVTEGSAAVRGAAAHLEPAREGVDALAERAGFDRPDDSQLRTIVKVHGGLTIAAGAALALGKAPRLAALALAVLTFPSVVANLVASRRGTQSDAAKSEQVARAVRALSFTGAALLAAADREGRPGLAWKMSHAKQLAAAGAASGVAGLGRGGATAAGKGASKGARKAGKAAATAGKASAAGGAKAVKAAKAAEAKAAKLAGKAAAASAATGAQAAKHSKVAETKAAKLAGGIAKKAASGAAGAGAGAAATAKPKRSELRAQKKAAKVTDRENARAVKVAAAQAAEAEKAARVAERAEAKASTVSRRSLRAEAKASGLSRRSLRAQAKAAPTEPVVVEDVVVVA